LRFHDSLLPFQKVIEAKDGFVRSATGKNTSTIKVTRNVHKRSDYGGFRALEIADSFRGLRGAILAQNAEQSELERPDLVKHCQQIKARFPLLRPKLYLPYAELQAIAVL
jgi:hypothetical protein